MIALELLEENRDHPLEGARLVETCTACPTQYDVHLRDGRTLYFRYRFRRWSLQLGGPGGPGVNGDGDPDRDPLDGFLTPAEVLFLLEDAVPLLLRHLDGA